MNREERRLSFENFSMAVEIGLYEDLAWSKSELVLPSDLKNIKSFSIPKNITFKKENVTDVIEENSLVLVFCSAKNPGGGVSRGSIAQEEDISLTTSWFFQVKDIKGSYLNKHSDAINTDNMIYVEKGFLLKDKDGNDISPIPVSFVGATAPNIKGMKDQGHSIDYKLIKKTLALRVENILKLATQKNKETLILGAWGCGVFGLSSEMVAEVFKEKLNEGWFKGNIIFSIPNEKMLNDFEKIIKSPIKKINKKY